MLLITKRRKIGIICGHTIYAIAKTEVIPIPHSTVRSKMAYSNDENRSLVHSASKCNMSMLRKKEHRGVVLSIIPCTLYIDEMFSENILSEHHSFLALNFYNVGVFFVRYR